MTAAFGLLRLDWLRRPAAEPETPGEASV
jgi:hypothetical protein